MEQMYQKMNQSLLHEQQCKDEKKLFQIVSRKHDIVSLFWKIIIKLLQEPSVKKRVMTSSCNYCAFRYVTSVWNRLEAVHSW